jgi:hypothetical protein
MQSFLELERFPIRWNRKAALHSRFIAFSRRKPRSGRLENALAAIVLLACTLVAPSASAHAFLDRATPSVGGTVSGSPREVRLFFTQGVVAAFSGVRIVSEAGTAIPTGRVTVDPSDPTVVTVRLGRRLPPGTYTVTWHVVSVDTHPMQGSFRFNVT